MRFPGLMVTVLILLSGLSSHVRAETVVLSDEAAETVGEAEATEIEREMLSLLEAPLLFTKRHSYSGIHIYDTFYKWPPGGGGIYILENPAAPRDQWEIRPLIDPTTPETLGEGVYNDPNLSWDATRVLFTFKGEPDGSTAIYEINIDGTGLRQLSDPSDTVPLYQGSQGGQHDVYPAYLPDDRIVFLSTRPSGLVPCNNTGVAILHVMTPDGSDIHSISVNNVNEFDPAVMPDGRILFGRWEYIDKNALTIQSLWTVNPDGTQETALFANNMVFPEAILDARPVPGTHWIVGTLAKHNSTPRGTIALIDPHRGKNEMSAIVNLEYPDDPSRDTGDSCEPWPVTPDVFLFSGRPPGEQRNQIEMIDRQGRRIPVLSDPDICLHSPMLVQPRPRPPVIPATTDREATTGNFLVQDVYRGLEGVERGEVKTLRVIEETSRVSSTLMGGSPFNQVFLISAALAWSPKNFLGVVPVEEDGSAFFEVPSGRAVYLQALDAEGRLVQSMRTFVQAAPGTTRSCVGCHEPKAGTTASEIGFPEHLRRAPAQLQPENWGSGYIDYPRMVQPILDQHCARCHGGAEDVAGGMDLTGGWTEFFNNSYENLVSRRETQLEAYWIAGIDCMNGTAFWSSQIFPPRAHGSGAAPLADILVGGHDGRFPDLTRAERDLLMAWIDTNGIYHGTWDATTSGPAIRDWDEMRGALVAQMEAADCLRCHGEDSRLTFFENDWVNLQDPEYSRILRAPLAAGGQGYGLERCRERYVDPRRQRLHLLRRGYAHAVQPIEAFPRQEIVPPDPGGTPHVSFDSTGDPVYQAMLAIIRDAREKALAEPRVDMPGAEVIAGACRMFVPPPLPDQPPELAATVDDDGVVRLRWEQSAQTIGLEAELHRSAEAEFRPDEETRLLRTVLDRHVDPEAPEGPQHYALVLTRNGQSSQPVYARVEIPTPVAPDPPTQLTKLPVSSVIRLRWQAPGETRLRYHVERALDPAGAWERLTPEPIDPTHFSDGAVEPEVTYYYAVRSVSRRGMESERSEPIRARAVIIDAPVFSAAFEGDLRAQVYPDQSVAGKAAGGARVGSGFLDLRQGGHVTFDHHPHFNLTQPLSVECWVRFEEAGEMPVVVSCGEWRQRGWFLQRLGNQWRWHVGGVDCDGGQPEVGRWIHLVGSYDGRDLRLFQDGRLVAEQSGPVTTAAWPRALHIGQYSARPGEAYQVRGHIAGLKLYHRALSADEIAGEAHQPPPPVPAP